MKETDKRQVCKAEKKASIREALLSTANRRKSQVCKVFECKIVEKRLNKKQREELERLFLEGKWFYNNLLSIRQDLHVRLNEINTTHIKSVEHLDKDKNKLVDDLTVLTSQVKQAILARIVSNEKTIALLVKRGFQKQGSLNFKSELTCIPLKQYGNTYVFKSFNKVRIAGISGTVLVRTGNLLQIADELANANLVKKPDGYYLKVTAFINKENYNFIKTNGKEIGLDFGIKTSITTSEGEKLDVSIQESDRLKALLRELFRRVKGSKNRNKTIKLIQREYQKLSNKKQDKANKIVSKLKKYDRIYMQDELISGWHKGLFGKQVLHSCLGTVKAKLKALPLTVVLDKWIPTTKICPDCGKLLDLSLADRTVECSCGHVEDRDVHSAKNMIVIAKACFKNNSVPTEHRKVTLTEFRASALGSNAYGKAGTKK